MYLLTQKRQNDNGQEQLSGVNWTQREVSLHRRVTKIQSKNIKIQQSPSNPWVVKLSWLEGKERKGRAFI